MLLPPMLREPCDVRDRDALSAAFETITHLDAAGYYRHAGYNVEEIIPGFLYD